MKLNNKGFAISAILYSILIAFMLFLLCALAMFSSANTIMSAANDDLVNGSDLEAIQVKDLSEENICDNKDRKWYQEDIIVRINYKGSTMYWPKDFNVENRYSMKTTKGNMYKNITVTPSKQNIIDNPILTIKDGNNNVTEVILGDICG